MCCGEGVLVQGDGTRKARPRLASEPRGHRIALPYDHVLLQLDTASPAHA